LLYAALFDDISLLPGEEVMVGEGFRAHDAGMKGIQRGDEPVSMADPVPGPDRLPVDAVCQPDEQAKRHDGTAKDEYNVAMDFQRLLLYPAGKGAPDALIWEANYSFSRYSSLHERGREGFYFWAKAARAGDIFGEWRTFGASLPEPKLYMKKIALASLIMLATALGAKAQNTAASIMHSRDFFMVQLGYDTWIGAP